MADLSLEFCGIKFKHPIIIASLETTNSPEVIKECVDAGAAGMIVKTLTEDGCASHRHEWALDDVEPLTVEPNPRLELEVDERMLPVERAAARCRRVVDDALEIAIASSTSSASAPRPSQIGRYCEANGTKTSLTAKLFEPEPASPIECQSSMISTPFVGISAKQPSGALPSS